MHNWVVADQKIPPQNNNDGSSSDVQPTWVRCAPTFRHGTIICHVEHSAYTAVPASPKTAQLNLKRQAVQLRTPLFLSLATNILHISKRLPGAGMINQSGAESLLSPIPMHAVLFGIICESQRMLLLFLCAIDGG